MSTAPAGWHPDPRGRHQQRYWDGSAWTDHVADAGVATIDPVDERPRFQDVGGPRPTDAAPASRMAATGGGSLWARPEAVAEPERAPEPAPRGEVAEPEAEPPPPEAPPQPRSKDLAVVLGLMAPGAGHLHLGGRRRTAGFTLLSATILAVVIAFLGFGPFLVGLGIYLTGAAYALLDLNDVPPRPIGATALGWLLVVCGTLLAFSLLLPWYRVRLAGGGFAFSASGFEALALIDGLLLPLGAVVAGTGLGVLAREGVPVRDLPPLLWRLAAAAGALALGLVVFRLLVDPVPATGPSGFDLSVGRAPGILLAGAAAVGAFGAGVAAARAGYRREP